MGFGGLGFGVWVWVWGFRVLWFWVLFGAFAAQRHVHGATACKAGPRSVQFGPPSDQQTVRKLVSGLGFRV